MRRLLLAAILFATTSVLAQTSPLDTVLHGHRWDYVVDSETFRLGHTANRLLSGQTIGKQIPKRKTQSPMDTPEEINQFMIESRSEAHASTKAAKENTKRVLSELGSSKSMPAPVRTSPSASRQDSESPKRLDIESCARNALDLLKRRRQISNQTPTLLQTQAALTYALETDRGAGGIVCTQGIPLLENAIISDEIEVIKLLSAIVSRTGDERERLIAAASLAYSPGDNPALLNAWRTIWRRLAVAAVFEAGPLPTWKAVLSDLDQPTTRIDLKISNADSEVVIEPSTADMKNSMISGLTKLGLKHDDL